MDINQILNWIANYGFSIVMCLVLCFYINTTQKKLIESMGEITKSISQLCTKLGGNSNEVK